MIYYKSVILPLLLSLSLLAQPQTTQKANTDNARGDTKLDGIWLLSLESGEANQNLPVFNTAVSKKVVVFTSSDNKVQMIDPSTDTVWVGEKTGDLGGFRVNLPVKDQLSGTTKLMLMDGSIKGNTIFGVVKQDNGTLTWKAMRLPSAWQCSNHKPSHIATSEEEMRSLTTKYKCLGWHKISQVSP